MNKTTNNKLFPEEEIDDVKSSFVRDLKNIYGLFFLQEEEKFLLASVLKKDNSLHDLNPQPEALRIYAIDHNNEIAEFKDMCMILELNELNNVLNVYSKKYNKIKIIFSNDNCETIEEFYVDRIT